ncbi:hypothetical protein M8818_007438 [Zalaria obscura]|uniref:Uncharacterized protein n=1 Tax=Zalaria obscura TaxID=2024903 RepID=A0ACC3S639_9PEZI
MCIVSRSITLGILIDPLHAQKNAFEERLYRQSSVAACLLCYHWSTVYTPLVFQASESGIVVIHSKESPISNFLCRLSGQACLLNTGILCGVLGARVASALARLTRTFACLTTTVANGVTLLVDLLHVGRLWSGVRGLLVWVLRAV